LADSVIDRAAPGHGVDVKSALALPAPEEAAPIRSNPARAPDFDALVQQHLDFVWRLLRRLGLSASDADDATQQVFMIAARKLSEVPAGKERMFLYGTARRVAANSRRDRRRRREVPGELADEIAAVDALPDDRLELGRAALLLDELLDQLPDELRRVLVLAELEEASVPAIAELEGIAEGTAASRLRRARAAFEKQVSRARRRNPFGVLR
jgi:RNA polymerase sigma-70 factor (ECF subfamily)